MELKLLCSLSRELNACVMVVDATGQDVAFWMTD